MTARHPLVAVYADESCLGNGRSGATPGGLGSLVEFRKNDGTVQRFDLWASEPDTTNNRMALRSVIDTFSALSRKGNSLSVRFTTDSRYIVDGMTSWVFGWARNGWKRKTGAIENLHLWKEAIAATNGHEYQWQWVKGHAGHPQNEYANDLATAAAAQQSASGGLIASGFDAWLTARVERARSARQPALAPFPDGATFRASSSLPAMG